MDLGLAIFSGFFITTCVIQRIIVAWDTWHEAIRLHARDAWMRVQCQNESFFTNMRVHSDVCEVVQRAANRTPFLHALGAAVEVEVSWLPPVVVVLLGIATRAAVHFYRQTYKKRYIRLP